MKSEIGDGLWSSFYGGKKESKKVSLKKNRLSIVGYSPVKEPGFVFLCLGCLLDNTLTIQSCLKRLGYN